MNSHRSAPRWEPPTSYEPLPNLEGMLLTTSAPMHTALFDMISYLQWRRWPYNDTIAEAWERLRMTQDHAREAIDKRIVLTEVYERVLNRALQGRRSTPEARASQKRAVRGRRKAA